MELIPKTFVIVAMLAGCAGRLPPPAAPTAGWVDLARVASESALGKRLADEHATVFKSRQDELDKMSQQLAAAEKAKDKQLETMRAVAAQKQATFQAEVTRHEAQVVQKLRDAVRPVVARIAAERHLSTADVQPDGRLWSAEDLTDEVIRRLDAETYRPPVAPAAGKP